MIYHAIHKYTELNNRQYGQLNNDISCNTYNTIAKPKNWVGLTVIKIGISSSAATLNFLIKGL